MKQKINSALTPQMHVSIPLVPLLAKYEHADHHNTANFAAFGSKADKVDCKNQRKSHQINILINRRVVFSVFLKHRKNGGFLPLSTDLLPAFAA
jgi:hypothetical protein